MATWRVQWSRSYSRETSINTIIKRRGQLFLENSKGFPLFPGHSLPLKRQLNDVSFIQISVIQTSSRPSVWMQRICGLSNNGLPARGKCWGRTVQFARLIIFKKSWRPWPSINGCPIKICPQKYIYCAHQDGDDVNGNGIECLERKHLNGWSRIRDDNFFLISFIFHLIIQQSVRIQSNFYIDN